MSEHHKRRAMPRRSMTKILPVLGLLVFIFGCATAEDISSNRAFTETIGKDKETKRITYLYDMNEDGIYEIWDSIYRYGQGIDENGKLIMHTWEPLEVIAIGTSLDVDGVDRLRSKGGNSIVAHGVLHLSRGSVPFRYHLGLRNYVRDAPWVSPIYEPRKLREIEQDEGGNSE
jgi:hypothetical protein